MERLLCRFGSAGGPGGLRDLRERAVGVDRDVLAVVTAGAGMGESERDPDEVAGLEFHHAALGEQRAVAADLVLDLVGVQRSLVDPLVAGGQGDRSEPEGRRAVQPARSGEDLQSALLRVDLLEETALVYREDSD